MGKTHIIGDAHGLKFELGLILNNIPDDVHFAGP
jgi:hypothetical protein